MDEKFKKDGKRVMLVRDAKDGKTKGVTEGRLCVFIGFIYIVCTLDRYRATDTNMSFGFTIESRGRKCDRQVSLPIGKGVSRPVRTCNVTPAGLVSGKIILACGSGIFPENLAHPRARTLQPMGRDTCQPHFCLTKLFVL